MKRALLFSFFAVAAMSPSYAASLYNITIDSSSLPSGTTGFIDMAFNGGFSATATVENFSLPGGSLDSATIFTQGNVDGALPGTVTMDNNNTDYDEGIDFGSSISFLLALSGTPSGSIGDTFTLSFFNSDFSGVLLTGNVNDGWIAQFQMDTIGNITATAFANPSGGPSFADIGTATPEPASGFLALAGLIGLGIGVTGRKRPRK